MKLPKKRWVIGVGILAIAIIAIPLAVWRGSAQREMPAESKTLYHCGMHPTIVSDKPGSCPICQMRLTKIEAGPKEGAARPRGKPLSYRHPMRPEITSPVPAKDEMGMDYIPVYEEEAPAGGPALPSHAEVYISPERQQLIGVKTALVERRPLAKTIRTVGLVEMDESRQAHIESRVNGWIHELFVNYTGQAIKQGDPVLTIYSPEFVTTEEEYLLALETLDKVKSSPYPDVIERALSLVKSTKRRMLLWSFTEEQILELERTQEPQTHVKLYSPIDGVVWHKNVQIHERVEVGKHLFDVADLSQVWVQGAVYEYELPMLQVGQQAAIELAADPGAALAGRVDFIYPFLDEMTRTAKVRFVFDNAEQKLKPGMYADVKLAVELGERLVVPEDAVIDTGDERLVFVVEDDGRFLPREVEVGQEADGWREIRLGLAVGERVATAANFLIDSESRIRSAVASFGASGGAHAGHGQ